MLLRDLTKVWISEYEEINDHGEKTKKWKFKKEILTIKDVENMTVKELEQTKIKELIKKEDDGTANLNIQQDVNELDRNSAGVVDYSILNARTTMDYNIKKGNGISFTDISKLENFVPDYTVTDCPKIGSTILYKLEKYNGD